VEFFAKVESDFKKHLAQILMQKNIDPVEVEQQLKEYKANDGKFNSSIKGFNVDVNNKENRDNRDKDFSSN